MLIIISPAKTQDFNSPSQTNLKSELRFKEESLHLLRELKKYSVNELKKLMKVSDKIAELNYRRFQDFDEGFNSGKQALTTFKGDVYRPFDLDQYSEKDFQFAQNHLRILSGFYGLLRPFDVIQPYRLEMKIKLKNKKGGNLYQFWGHKLMNQLIDDLEAQGDDVLINLASNEYSKALDLKTFSGRLITPIFLEKKENDESKVIAIFSKKARGMMSNFIIKKHLTNPSDLKKFNQEGYQYSESLSDGDQWVFIR